ncbi:CHAT domain-containing protein [Xylaria digitata]|nr:CHAT domain-containing protein [Xylaria digitata]
MGDIPPEQLPPSLDVHITCLQDIVLSIGSHSNGSLNVFDDLAKALCERFARDNQPEDLTSAITFWTTAIGGTSEEHQRRRLLASAIKHIQATLDCLPPGFPNIYRRVWLSRLSSMLYAQSCATQPKSFQVDIKYRNKIRCALARLRIERLVKWSLEDVQLSIPLARIMTVIASDAAEKCEYTLLLAELLGKEAQHSNTSDGLDEAISLQEKILSDTSYELSKSRRAEILCDLAACYNLRYRDKNSEPDLDNGIAATKAALGLVCPADHSKLFPRILNNHADLLWYKYRITFDVILLDESIKHCQKAVLVSKRTDPDRVIYEHNLGQKLHDRFDHTHHLSDLDESIKIARDLFRTTTGHPFRPQILNALASRLDERFSRSRQECDLIEAVRYQDMALQELPKQHKERAIFILNMSRVLFSQYRQTKKSDYLYKSINHARQAQRFATPASWNYSSWLSRIGVILETLYEIALTKRVPLADGSDLLREAIEHFQSAVRRSRPDNQDSARYYLALGRLFRHLHRLTNNPEHLTESTNYYTQCYQHNTGRPLTRINGARGAAFNLVSFGQLKWNEAANCLSLALDLLPNIIVRSNVPEDHIDILSNVSGLAPVITSVFIRAGRPIHEALQALERSSGMIAVLSMHERSTMVGVQGHRPELHEQYEALRAALRPGFLEEEPSSVSAYSDMAWRRHETVRQIENLESLLSRENNFLVGTSISENDFLQLAAGDYLVTFNISYLGSHAFLISDTIRVIELPDLKPSVIRRMIDLFSPSAQPRDGEEVEDDSPEPVNEVNTITSAMTELWDVAVKPVLAALGIVSNSPDQLPCVRWVGGGLMSLVPLHAAGDNSTGSTENAFCRIVSSYAPTFRALKYSRRLPKASNTTWTRMLAVGMPLTPGYDNINAEAEIDAIEKHIGSRCSVKKLWHPKKAEVLKQLNNNDMVHFACHGRANISTPRQSCLILGPHGDEQLAIADLEKLDDFSAQIAYLSACSTARLSVNSLLYEGIHLANFFNLAGFRHVIGTTMKAGDTPAVFIASKFYEFLLRHEDWTTCHIPRILHDAVSEYRNIGNNSVKIFDWSPFIHVGS